MSERTTDKVAGVSQATQLALVDEVLTAHGKLLVTLAEGQLQAATRNWKFLVGAIPVLIAALGGVYFMLIAQFTPLILRIDLAERDRTDLRSDLASVSTRVAILTATNTEIETQIRCLEAVRDLQQLHQEQWNAVLWKGDERTGAYPLLPSTPMCGPRK